MLKVIGRCGCETPYLGYRSHVFTGASGWEITKLLPYRGPSYG